MSTNWTTRTTSRMKKTMKTKESKRVRWKLSMVTLCVSFVVDVAKAKIDLSKTYTNTFVDQAAQKLGQQ